MGGSEVSHFGGKSLDTAHGGHTPQIRPYATAEPPQRTTTTVWRRTKGEASRQRTNLLAVSFATQYKYSEI
eukprot:g13161.t1 g13161   contig8:51833-52285(-)